MRNTYRSCAGTTIAVVARVPSQQHEVLVDLFRNRSQLARELLDQCAGIEIAEGAAELASIDLSQVVSIEYRADAVTVIRDKRHAAKTAVIVEIQLQTDRDKRLTWPLYVTALRARLGCPVLLLVIAPKRQVARWALRRIETGHPGFSLEPIVIGYENIPRITDMQSAAAAPELAVLSVMAHRDLKSARIAASVVMKLSEDKRKVYLDLVCDALTRAAEKRLEAWMMEKYEYQSATVRGYISEGLQQAALDLARSKLGAVPGDVEARIRSVRDDAVLRGVIVALGLARDAAEARTVIDDLESLPSDE